jgi:hypothetical protein
MTEYVLDIEVIGQDHHVDTGSWTTRTYTKYFFKIDINGNVNIAIQYQPPSGANPHREEYKKKETIVLINDNIPIPTYLIDIIQGLIQRTTGMSYKRFSSDTISIQPWGSNITCHPTYYQEYWAIIINTIIKIKQEIRNLVQNPQDNLDIKTQLDTYIAKTILHQENIAELERKIENIQTAYFDSLNDNKKLKDIIKEKDNKQIELQVENRKLLNELNTMKQVEETRKHEQQKMEELEKERLWIEYKLQKQNYNPLSR